MHKVKHTYKSGFLGVLRPKNQINTLKINLFNGYKHYINGGTIEKIYKDTKNKKQIGYLNPNETAICIGTIDSKPIIIYNVDNDKNVLAIGIVNWLGGVC